MAHRVSETIVSGERELQLKSRRPLGALDFPHLSADILHRLIHLISIADVLPVPEGHLPHGLAIAFLFALGACVGSFLNVVVWRLPRGESLVSPPSHCPKCGKPLKWYDNLPIFGWIKLAGKCRFCRQPISIRYPIVELITALLFVFYYVMYYMIGVGPGSPIPTLLFSDAPGSAIYTPPGWPILLLHLFLISSLLAAGLIDAERYEIPLQITLLLAIVSVATHAIYDEPRLSGALSALRTDYTVSPTAALAAGGTVGLLLSILLVRLGVLKRSFPDGEPEVGIEHEGRSVREFLTSLPAIGSRDASPTQTPSPSPSPSPSPGFFAVRMPLFTEMGKEITFLLPPLLLAVGWWLATSRIASLHIWWEEFARRDWAAGLLGSLFGGLVGGFVVWLTRILGTLGFGKVAMGLGDADLMFAVGTAIGAGQATIAFFLAPFFGMVLAIYYLVTRKRNELPFGPYLAIASAAVMFLYGPIADWLSPGLGGLGLLVRQWWTGDSGV